MQERFVIKWSGPIAVLIAMSCSACSLALAADEVYPSRPIKFLLPFPPGSGTDVQGRAVAGEMAKAIGQSVIIENKAGGNGFIATEQVARATPDGYTALMTSNSHLANKFLFKTIPYDPIREFKSVTLLKKISPLVLVVAAQALLMLLESALASLLRFF
jgi:tripartite-type tricarboxylate transporter receptor subunit TctC